MPQFETREIKLKVRTVFLREFERDLPKDIYVETYLSEIIETIAAERRASKIGHKKEKATKPGPVRHRQTPENVQRILHLRHAEGLSIETISARMNFSKSTVQYVLDRNHVKSPGFSI